MLSVRRPGARRRKRRRPLHWVGRARRGRRRRREEGGGCEGAGAPTAAGTGGGGPGRCDPPGPEGKGEASTGGEGLSLRGGEAPAWPLGQAERRAGEQRRCRGGSAAADGGGGAGPRRLLFSAPLGLGLPPSSPGPRLLSTPSFLFPPAGSCFASPPLGARRNQRRAAKTEEEALAAAAAASNMADASRAAQLGDPRRRPARPLASGPRGPGPPRGTIERARARGRARASPPGGRAQLYPPPPPRPPHTPPPRRCGNAGCSPLERPCRGREPLQSVDVKKNPNPAPTALLASLGNNIRVSVVSIGTGLFTRGLVDFFKTLLDVGLEVNRQKTS